MVNIIILFVSAFAMAALVGSLEAGTTASQSEFVEREQRLAQIQRFMSFKNFPRSIRQRVLQYFTSQGFHSHSERKNLWDDLPDFLRKEVALYINFHALERVKIFANYEPAFVQTLAMLLKSQLLLKDDRLYHAGDLSTEMYMLDEGTIKLFTERGVAQNTMNFELRVRGQFFGERAFLMEAFYETHAVALCPCRLLVLTREDYEGLLQYYPNYRHRIRREWVVEGEKLSKSSKAYVKKLFKMGMENILGVKNDDETIRGASRYSQDIDSLSYRSGY